MSYPLVTTYIRIWALPRHTKKEVPNVDPSWTIRELKNIWWIVLPSLRPYFQSLTLFTILPQKSLVTQQSCKILTDFCVGKYVLNCLFWIHIPPSSWQRCRRVVCAKKNVAANKTWVQYTYFLKPDPWHCKWQMMIAFPNSIKTLVTILRPIHKDFANDLHSERWMTVSM